MSPRQIALDPPLRTYLGVPIVLGLVFAYGKWVWAPLWKLGVGRRWN